MAKAKKTPAKKAAPKSSGAKKTKPSAKASTRKAASPVKSKASAGGKSKSMKPKTTAKSTAKTSPSSAGKSISVPTAKRTSVKWPEFITPLDDRLIVQVSSGEKMTAGGLYIPDTVTDSSGNFKGTVLVSGRGHRDNKGKIHPMEVKAGDVVLFSEFSGAKMNLMDQDVRILRESEILGIVD